MLTQHRQTRNAPGALEAPNTIRVMVEVFTETYDEYFECMTVDKEQVIDLLLPDDLKPCTPKIDAYITAEFPGWKRGAWWTPSENECDEF